MIPGLNLASASLLGSLGAAAQLQPVTSLAAVDDGLEELSITWIDPDSVPNSLLLVVTRDSIEVVNTHLSAGASQPYIVAGIGSYDVTITNKGDGVTNIDSTPASVSGVTVASVAPKRPNELADLDQWVDPAQETYGSNTVLTSIADQSGHGNSVQPQGGDTGDMTWTTGGPNGHPYYFFPTGKKWYSQTTSSASARTRFITATWGATVGAWVFWENNSGSGLWQNADPIAGTGLRPSAWQNDRSARLDDYPEAFPDSGRHVIAWKSDADGYTLYIDGVNQGRRPSAYADNHFYDNWYADSDVSVHEAAEYVRGLSELEIKAVTLDMGARQDVTLFATPSNLEEGIWVYEASPVLVGSLAWELSSVAKGDAHDGYGNVYEFCAIQLSSNSFIASYTGGYNGAAIGIARSADGVSWTKDGDPKVGQGFGGESGLCARSCLIKDGSNYHIYYSNASGGGDLCRVTSTDGGATFGSRTVILGKSTDSPSGFTGFANSQVMKDGSTYRLWVECFKSDFSLFEIFYTTGTDGVTWGALQGPITALTRGGMFGGPCVTKVGSSYEIYYHAALAGLTPTQLYHARTSTPDDISSWVQIPNPVFYLGEQASPITGADQLGDLSILFLLDGTTRAYFEQVNNANPENNILSSTLPYQPTA